MKPRGCHHMVVVSPDLKPRDYSYALMHRAIGSAHDITPPGAANGPSHVFPATHILEQSRQRRGDMPDSAAKTRLK